MTKLYLKRM